MFSRPIAVFVLQIGLRGCIMKAQLGLFLHLLKQHQHQIAIAYFSLAGLSATYWARIRPTFMSDSAVPNAIAEILAAILAVVASFIYLLLMVIYLLHPNYVDHAQPLVASISWLWMRGRELYPNWATGDVSISVYGPITFLINGAALLLSPSILASKLPGVLSLVAALAATSIVLRRTTNGNYASLLLLGSAVLLLDTFHAHAYWNRPEPFLILISALALLVISFRLPSMLEGISIGLLAGIAAGFKVHAFIYLLPTWAAALSKIQSLRDRIFVAFVGSLCAVTFAFLPYFESGVSVAGHLRILRVAFDEGWSLSLFRKSLLFLFVLAAPITLILILQKPELNPSKRWFLATLGISALVMTVISGKQGGGRYYLLPLIPVFVYGIAIAVEKFRIYATLIFATLFLTYGPNLLLDTRWGLRYDRQIDAQSEHDEIAELKTYLDSYPNAQFGVSDNEHFPAYFYRVFSVWNGRPLHVDFSAWMDLAYTGVDEKHILRFIKGCAVQTWILPLGAPFQLSNFFTGEPMLSENFRQTFLSSYRQIKSGNTYQIWQCNSNP
jgi:hypothetical protein